MASHGVIDSLELWTRRDLNGDGMIGDLPPAGDGEPSALASRVDRALRYVTEQGGDWTRRELCDHLGLLSQTEWAAFYKELQQRGIVDGDGKTLLAVSYKQAREMWDKDRPKSFAVTPAGRLLRK